MTGESMRQSERDGTWDGTIGIVTLGTSIYPRSLKLKPKVKCDNVPDSRQGHFSTQWGTDKKLWVTYETTTFWQKGTRMPDDRDRSEQKILRGFAGVEENEEKQEERRRPLENISNFRRFFVLPLLPLPPSYVMAWLFSSVSDQVRARLSTSDSCSYRLLIKKIFFGDT